MLRAMQEVLASIRQDRPSVIAYIEKNFNVNRAVAEESYEDIHGVIVEDLMMPESQVKSYLESAHGRGELSRALAVGEVIDYSFLKALK